MAATLSTQDVHDIANLLIAVGAGTRLGPGATEFVSAANTLRSIGNTALAIDVLRKRKQNLMLQLSEVMQALKKLGAE